MMKPSIFHVKRAFSNSFLLKLIFSYSLIFVIMLVVLSLVISNTVTSDLLQKEINYENQITRRVSDSFEESITGAKKKIQNMYYLDNATKKSFFDFLENDEREITSDTLQEKTMVDNLFQMALNQDVNTTVDIVLYKTKTDKVFSYSRELRETKSGASLHEYPWFQSILSGDSVYQIVPSYRPTYMKNDDRPVYSFAAGIRNSQNQVVGIIVINMDPSLLKNSYAEYEGNIKGPLLVMNKTGQVFYDSSGKYYSGSYPFFNQLQSKQSYVVLDKERLVSITESANDFITAGIIPKNKVTESIKIVNNTIYFIMFGCIGISIVIIYSISRFFSKKIKVLIKAMREVENGNFNNRIPLREGNDEIEQIYRHFNKMCGRLEDYIERMYVAEIRTKDAELTALQTQINPHFLYNTLEMIRMRAIHNYDEEVSEMIYMLANIFRSNVKNREAGIRIEEELNYAEAYLELHKLRFHDQLQISFDIDPEILKFGIIKIVLQPLIENSLKYGGIGEIVSLLQITIKGERAGNTILLQVEDNGQGIEENKLEELKEQLATVSWDKRNQIDSIGLQNINDRIKITYGEQYGLDIFSKKNSFTKVVARIPALLPQEINDVVYSINRR